MAQTILRSLSAHLPETDGTTVRLFPVDIYGGQPSTSTFDLVQGLHLAAEKGPQILNLSLGGDIDSPVLHEIIRHLRQQGVLTLAAAGNQPTTDPFFPAAYDEVLAVTAVDPSGQIASYANRGDFIDLAAPGSDLVQVGDQFFVGNGTSHSAAFLSGAVAAYVSSSTSPASTPASIAQRRTAADGEAWLRQQYGINQSPAPAR
jgi:subtilisin family serine protease